MGEEFFTWLDNQVASELSRQEKKGILELLQRIYMGSHIREEGVRQDEDFISQNESHLEILSSSELVKSRKWYGNRVVAPTNRGIGFAKTIIQENLQRNSGVIKSLISSINESLLGFIVNHLLSRTLSLEVSEADIGEYYWDWQEIIFLDKRAKRAKNELLEGLKSLGLSVSVHYYVSTRGKELRELNYVIAPEIRRYLQDEVCFPEISWQIIANLRVAAALCNGYTSDEEYDVFFSFDDEPEIPEKYQLAAASKALMALREKSGLKYHTIDNEGFEIRAVNQESVHRIAKGIVTECVDELLSPEDSKEQNQLTDAQEHLEAGEIPRLIKELVEKKMQLFRACARVHQKSLFRSTPSTEQIVVRLQLLPHNEEGLSVFVNLLHHFLIEASDMVLQFNQSEEREHKLIYNWLGFSIGSERREKYNQAGMFFRELNNLRNYFSHLEHPETVSVACDILEQWTRNAFPYTREEILSAKVRILSLAKSALSSLEHLIQQDYRADVK